LNIDADKISQVHRLWINCKVTDLDTGIILGVLAISIDMNEAFDELFAQYDADNVRGVIIDSSGLLQMDSTLTGDIFDTGNLAPTALI
jgi:anti-anti-sigma regulatory factor